MGGKTSAQIGRWLAKKEIVEFVRSIGNDNTTNNSQATPCGLEESRGMLPCGNYVAVVAGMTIADGENVTLKASCLPSADCNVWFTYAQLWSCM
jgi:hypothetical protein